MLLFYIFNQLKPDLVAQTPDLVEKYVVKFENLESLLERVLEIFLLSTEASFP